MDFKERFSKLAYALGLSVAQLQKKLGVSNAYAQNTKSPSAKVLAALREQFPQVNADWLKTGEGEMMPAHVFAAGKDDAVYVPLLPISVQGGSPTDFEAQVHEYECEMVVSPIKDASHASTITGDSMAPEYPSGCKILVKRINEAAFIEWGRTYELDTVNGPVVKNVFPCKEDDSRIVCRSINPDFDDFTIAKEDIRAWYRVLMLMSLK